MVEKTLETQRLELVPFSQEFVTSRYIEWLNNPTVVRFSELRHRQHTLQSCQTYLESFAGSPHHFWAILLKDFEKLHIGNITAHVDVKNNIADIGILIGEEQVWGQGIGCEAWQSVCSFLLNELKIRKVTAGTLSANTGMLKIMKRSGMLEDGKRKNHYLINEEQVDMVHYCIFNPHF